MSDRYFVQSSKEPNEPIFYWVEDRHRRQRFGYKSVSNCTDKKELAEKWANDLNASAIRAAVSKKTAESGHSPSTHNSESE